MASRETGIENLMTIVKTTNNTEVRLAAIVGLGYAGGPEARKFLITLLQTDKRSLYRKAAAIALGRASSYIQYYN